MGTKASAQFIGRMVKDPVARMNENTGAATVEFSLAVDDRVGAGKEKRPSYFDFVAFQKKGEVVANYLQKGDLVGIDATPRQERWEKEGAKHSRVKFIVDEVVLLGKRDSGEGE